MSLSDTKIQVNAISKKKDDEIDSHDLDLPKNLDMLADLDSLLKDQTVISQCEKLLKKYVKKPDIKEKVASVLSGHRNVFMPPSHGGGGIIDSGPSGGLGGHIIGGPNDMGPMGGSNLVGPNSSLFSNPKVGHKHGLKDDSDEDDPLTFKPSIFGMGAPPDNDDFPPFPGHKKGGPPGGFGGGFGGFGGGRGGSSGGNFYM